MLKPFNPLLDTYLIMNNVNNTGIRVLILIWRIKGQFPTIIKTLNIKLKVNYWHLIFENSSMTKKVKNLNRRSTSSASTGQLIKFSPLSWLSCRHMTQIGNFSQVMSRLHDNWTKTPLADEDWAIPLKARKRN